MSAARQAAPGRRRLRTALIAAVTVCTVLGVGVGTASAGDRGWWGKHRKPRPTASAGRSPSSTPPASARASAGASAGVGGSASASAPGATPSRSATTPTPAPGAVTPPAANAGVDYQIGAPYTPPAGVTVVSRDHGVSPAAGKYNICYVNAFQAQPEELSWWKSNHDDLLLKRNGSYVVDGDWNEVLFDVSTAAKRTALAAVVNGWIDQCATKGFQAVEADNLDSWTRSSGTLTKDQAVAFAKLITAYAHGRGLAMAQKNTVELASTGRSAIGFDFAVAEECADYDECDGYIDGYGDHVIVIEYDSTHFQQACTQYGTKLSIIQRDRNVTAPGSSGYVYKSC